MLSSIVEIARALNILAKAVQVAYNKYKKHKLEKEYAKAEKDPYRAFSDHFSG